MPDVERTPRPLIATDFDIVRGSFAPLAKKGRPRFSRLLAPSSRSPVQCRLLTGTLRAPSGVSAILLFSGSFGGDDSHDRATRCADRRFFSRPLGLSVARPRR